jgi:hypothetical protein
VGGTHRPRHVRGNQPAMRKAQLVENLLGNWRRRREFDATRARAIGRKEMKPADGPTLPFLNRPRRPEAEVRESALSGETAIGDQAPPRVDDHTKRSSSG